MRALGAAALLAGAEAARVSGGLHLLSCALAPISLLREAVARQEASCCCMAACCAAACLPPLCETQVLLSAHWRRQPRQPLASPRRNTDTGCCAGDFADGGLEGDVDGLDRGHEKLGPITCMAAGMEGMLAVAYAKGHLEKYTAFGKLVARKVRPPLPA